LERERDSRRSEEERHEPAGSGAKYV
jgi:hypothetical protein